MPVKNLINIPMKELFTLCECNNCNSNKFQILSMKYINEGYKINHQFRDNPKFDYIPIIVNNLCNQIYPRNFVMKKQERNPDITFELYLDVNLNIIIPEIKTIIINNYAPFSIYGLYSIKHLINKSNNIIFNQYSTDSQSFNDIEKVKKACNNYINSIHQRDLFNDGILFNHILDFFEYGNIIKTIEYHLLFQNAIKLDKSQEVEEKYINQIAKLIEEYDYKIKKLETERDMIYKKYIQDVNLIQLEDLVNN
jgi:hypothetical protein